MPQIPNRPLPPTPQRPALEAQGQQPAGTRSSAPPALEGKPIRGTKLAPGARLLADIVPQTGPQKDIISRVAKKKWAKKGKPQRKGRAGYAYKGLKKNANDIRKVLKQGFIGLKVSGILIANKKVSLKKGTAQGISQIDLIFSAIEAIDQLHKESLKAQKTSNKKKKLLKIAQSHNQKATQALDANPSLAAKHQAFGAISQQMAQRKRLLDFVASGTNATAKLSSSALTSGATIALTAKVIGVTTATTLTAIGVGVGLGIPVATYFGYGAYKLSRYANRKAKANKWECTLVHLEKKQQKPETQKNIKHYETVKKKLIKKGTLKPEDPQIDEHMRAYVFNQCLQTKSSFAIAYIKECLMEEIHTGKGREEGSTHKFLEELGFSDELMYRMDKEILSDTYWNGLYEYVQAKDKADNPDQERKPLDPNQRKEAIHQLRDKAIDAFLSDHLRI